MEKLSTLYDHYKDTCAVVGAASRRRDRLMLWVLVVLALFSLEAFVPSAAQQVISGVLARQYNVSEPIDFTLMGNVIWLTLLIIAVRYFQTAAYVERQYPYLHRLEAQLNELIGEGVITREGKSYLAEYPLFQDWLAFLYRVALPILLMVIATMKVCSEWATRSFSASLAIDTAVYLLLAISVVLYLIMLRLPQENKAEARKR